MRIHALGLLLVLLPACEEDATPGPAAAPDGGAIGTEAGAMSEGGTPGSDDDRGFCDATLGVVVRALEACCTPDDKATGDYRFSHDLAAALLPVCTSTLGASLSKGRVTVNAAARDACYAAYAETYAPGKCANITQTFSDPSGPSCRQAFAGVGAAGAPCLGDHECQDGLTCVGYTQTADGSCIAPPSLGQPCGAAKTDGGAVGLASLEFGDHPSCASGARCDSLSGTCVAADPEPPPSADGGPCTSSRGCQPGLYCEDGTCRPKKAAGGTCTGSSFDTECIGRCDAPSGEPGTCVSFCGSP